ncbi:HutD family protein [bacterium]|nr:HutD family protein [bacterium]
MLEAQVIRFQDLVESPWKNGQGTTREIAREASEPFLWRLSRAAVAGSGPFSSYPGYDRSLVLLRGSGTLLSGAKKRSVSAMVAYRFSGDDATHLELSSPTEDFNLFTLRGKARGSSYPSYFSPEEEMQLPVAGQRHFVHCVEGRLEIFEPNGGGRFALAPGDTFSAARNSDKEYLNLRARAVERATALWTVIHLLKEGEK